MGGAAQAPSASIVIAERLRHRILASYQAPKVGAIGLARRPRQPEALVMTTTNVVDTSTASKIWFITGSSRGLGAALAEAALRAGHRVVATSRNPADLARIVAIAPERARAVALDVTDPKAARAAIGAAIDAFGRIDVVVNNAGYGNVASIEDVTEQDFRAQFETNFFGVLHVTRAALPVLRKQRSGHILNVSSIGGRRGSPGLGAYQSAKFAVGGLTEVLALEVRPLGIRVTNVEPGGFRTDWGGSSMTVAKIEPDYEATVGFYAKAIREHAGAAHGDPAKAAKAILELAAMADPPKRLLLGTDAMFLARMVAEERAEEDTANARLSASTDVEGMPDFAELPIAKKLLELRK